MAFNIETFKNTFWSLTDGDLYVSSTGSDLQGDGSPTFPFETIQKAINTATAQEVIVVGTGQYNEELDGGGKSISLYADGLVTLDGGGSSLKSLTNFDGVNSILRDLKVRGYVVNTDSNFKSIIRCVFEGGSMTGIGANVRNSVFNQVNLRCDAPTNFVNTSFFGSQVDSNGNLVEIRSCLINASSSFNLDSTATTFFNFSNVESGATVTVDSTSYSSNGALSTGTGFQANGTGNAIVLNDMSLLSGDYSLENSSPLLSSGEFGLPQGAFGKGISIRSLSDFSFSVSEGIEVTPEGYFKLKIDSDTGEISTSTINLGSVQKIGLTAIFGDGFFEIIPSSISVNSSSADLEPRSMSYRMRYSANDPNLTINPVSFLWGITPKIDSNGRGNADPDFDHSSARNIVAQYLQIEILISSNQVFLVQEDLDCLLQENGCKLIWKT